jgi:hypothetical protein
MKSTRKSNSESFESFLSNATKKAQQAADAAVGLHKARTAKMPPVAFDSIEDWHSFDATLDQWLQKNERSICTSIAA